jgi:hypothetical protein
MRIRELAAVLALGAIAIGCTENPDPRKPSLEQMQTGGLGGWIVATTTEGWAVRGELISATPEYVHILRIGQSGAALVYLRTRQIANAKVYTYESEGGHGLSGLLGVLSTATHGFVLILTAPIWILSASIAAAAESSHVLVEYPDEDIPTIAKWARFPQGIPPNVDEEALVLPPARRTPKPLPPVAPAPDPNALPPGDGSPGAGPGSVVPPQPLAPPGETTPTPPERVNPSALFQRAKAAAAANDCAAVLEISGNVQLADQPFWDAVFSKEPSIRRCLGL